MSNLRFADIATFYAMRGGEHSGEDYFGVWWFEGSVASRGPRFRVSVVHDTGDVYALNLWECGVELLATLEGTACSPQGIKHDPGCVYNVAERLFEGWAQAGPKNLDWARERLAAVGVVTPLADNRGAIARRACECGASSLCVIPQSCTLSEWNEWWRKHPARAGIKPLTREAAERKGAPLR